MENFRPGEAVDDENPMPVRVMSGGDVQSLYTRPMGYEQIGSAQLAASHALDVPADAKMALVQNNGGSAVRWRDDGQGPTANQGMRLDVGGEHVFLGDLATVVFHDEGSNAVLDVSYYG